MRLLWLLLILTLILRYICAQKQRASENYNDLLSSTVVNSGFSTLSHIGFSETSDSVQSRPVSGELDHGRNDSAISQTYGPRLS